MKQLTKGLKYWSVKNIVSDTSRPIIHPWSKPECSQKGAFKQLQIHEIFHQALSSLKPQSMSAYTCAIKLPPELWWIDLHPSCAGLSHIFITALSYILTLSHRLAVSHNPYPCFPNFKTLFQVLCNLTGSGITKKRPHILLFPVSFVCFCCHTPWNRHYIAFKFSSIKHLSLFLFQDLLGTSISKLLNNSLR